MPLRLNEDLVEALAVQHDIGHPPFGHAGEETLDECLRDVGGFSHNRQALRIVEQLERRYPEFPGLESLARSARRSGRAGGQAAGVRGPLLEAQVVDAADSVAYDTHDADDALELGAVATRRAAGGAAVARSGPAGPRSICRRWPAANCGGPCCTS